MDQGQLDRCSAAELSDGIGQLHAAGAAVHRSLLEFVVAADRREIWRDDGVGSMAAWLVARCGLAHGTATQWVAVAQWA